MGRLNDKAVLITGGTSGIGLAAARRCLAEGARVAITGSSAARLATAREALGDSVLTIRADAGDVAAQQDVAVTVARAFGRLDGVVLNAGMGDFRPIEQWDEAAFDRSVAVNLKGPFFLVRALLPVLANPSSIVLMASINGRIGMPNSSIYGATKAALVSLARTLSGELIGRGVRVNAVSPGPVATPLHDRLGLVGDALDALVAQIPLGRRGTPDEIADAVVFLVSGESGFTVGSEFVVDGGMSNL
jgi:NAD(P)-dependent dehydrogenase (short-subunit alcohol dehydrogenase family)